MISFIDSILLEYNAFQRVLYDDKSLMNEDDRVKRVAKRKLAQENLPVNATLVHRVKKMAGTLTAENSDLSVLIKKERKALLGPLNADFALFNLNLSYYLWGAVEKLFRARDKSFPALVTSSNNGEKLALLGEMLLQEFVTHEPGLHLVIASTFAIRQMRDTLLREVFSEGLFVSWRVLGMRSKVPASLAASYCQRLHHLLSHQHKVKAYSDEWICTFLKAVANLECDEVLPHFIKMPIPNGWLLTLKKRVLEHVINLKDLIEKPEELRRVCDEISHAAEAVLEILEKSRFCRKVKLLAEQANIETYPQNLYKPIEECFEAVGKHDTMVGLIILSGRLLSIDPRRWEIRDVALYPKDSALYRLAKFSPEQFICHATEEPIQGVLSSISKADSTVVLALPRALIDLDLAKLALPLRSLHIFGYESTLPIEWSEIANIAMNLQTVCNPSFIYCETSDSSVHNCELDLI